MLRSVDVRGQVALVTGGASGLGFAFASILVQAGARVVIADRNAKALEKAVPRSPTWRAAGQFRPGARSGPPRLSPPGGSMSAT